MSVLDFCESDTETEDDNVMLFNSEFSAVTTLQCPSLSGYSLSSSGNNNIGNIKTCTYTPLSSEPSVTTDDLNKYQVAFGYDQNINDQLLPNYCGQKTDLNCPTSEIKGYVMEGCSRFTSIRNSTCLLWQSKNKDLAETVQTQYCDKFNTDDCLCIRREDNEEFKLIEENVETDPISWFRPCHLPQTYIVPPSIIKEVNDSDLVPCSEFNQLDAANNGELRQKQMDILIVCQGKLQTDEFPLEVGSTSDRFWDKYEIIVWIILIIVILIAVGALIFHAKNKKKMRVNQYLRNAKYSGFEYY